MTIHPVPGLDSQNGHTATYLFFFVKTLLSSSECLPTSLSPKRTKTAVGMLQLIKCAFEAFGKTLQKIRRASQEMNFECQPEAAEALSRFAQGVVLVAQWQQDSGYAATLLHLQIRKNSDVLYDEATKNG